MIYNFITSKFCNFDNLREILHKFLNIGILLSIIK